MTSVAEREDNFLADVKFPTFGSGTQTLGQPQYDICKMKRLIDFKLPVSSDVMKAVMTNRLMWKEFDTRIEKQLQDLARKKAQVSSDIELLENSTIEKQLQDLARKKAQVSSDIELLENSTIMKQLQELSLKEARLSIDIEMLEEYRIRALDLKPEDLEI